jgi:hypothetical protein
MIEVLSAGQSSQLGVQSNRVGFRLSGKLTAEERERVFVPEVEGILESQGSIRLLLQIDEDFSGGEPGALDGVFLGRRIDRIEKLAVIGKPDRLFPLKLASRHMKGELRVFSAGEIAEAWRWLED